MKKLFVILLGVFALGAATPAQAQVKFGVKGGLNVTNMTFTKDIFDVWDLVWMQQLFMTKRVLM